MARCPRSLLLTVSLAALSLPWLAGFSAHLGQRESGLIVHEWGTLTSVADRNGQPVAWHPRSDPYGLPNFVEHLKTENFKRLLQGTIRMETPVVYFYSASPLTASVQVRFSRGVITEWYPHASRVEPDPEADLAETALYQRRSEGRPGAGDCFCAAGRKQWAKRAARKISLLPRSVDLPHSDLGTAEARRRRAHQKSRPAGSAWHHSVRTPR